MSETPESNPGTLVVSSPKALAIANRQLRIAGQALARIGRERYIEFFATHPQASKAFIAEVSHNYPLTESMITCYSGLWDWNSLSWNRRLSWTVAFIDRYSERWKWGALSQNQALPWSESLLSRFAASWDWRSISRNEALPWSDALLERFITRWDWGFLSSNEALPWTDALIDRYADRWVWSSLSGNTALPWSDALFDRYAGSWNWSNISLNEALPWSEGLIDRYADSWNWYVLSLNKGLPWNESLLDRYINRWHWGRLSFNSALPWTDALIDRYANLWNWSYLSGNSALPWSEAFLERYAERLDWCRIEDNVAVPWTQALIDRYVDSLCWGFLSFKGNLPWSEALIDHNCDSWEWEYLSANEAIPWTEALIDRYADRWDWEQLSSNSALPWSEALVKTYVDRWSWEYGPVTTFLLQWPEASIRAVMDLMLQKLGRGSNPRRAFCAADVVDHPKDEQHHENLAQSAGLDPALMEAGIYLAGFHIETGARAFAAYCKAMIDDLGDDIKPHLKQLYAAVRFDPRTTEDMQKCMDSMASVEDADVENLLSRTSDMDDPTTVLREMERLCSEFAQAEATAAASVPARPDGITRRDALRPFMDKLEDLLRQEDDPPATMRWLETCFYDEGLVGEMRTDDPMAFAIDLMENLLEKDPDSYIVPLQDPRTFENAEELVLAMLKGTWDH